MITKEQAAQLDYSIADVADIIGMSRESVRRYIQAGLLKAEKAGKSYRIRKLYLVQFLNTEGRTWTKGDAEEKKEDAEY